MGIMVELKEGDCRLFVIDYVKVSRIY